LRGQEWFVQVRGQKGLWTGCGGTGARVGTEPVRAGALVTTGELFTGSWPGCGYVW